ncbi:MAG: hypothetical protein IJY99_00450 [Alphaproteobacteria bacterium]|nr:hypothetical protein [Alphaproteobacteria bacterium]
MRSQKIANSIKNAMGTVFLLAGAFFVCSTLLSMRAVLADPIAPVNATVMAPQATVAGATSRATSGRATNGRATATRANPRGNGATSRTTVARTTANVSNSRATTARNVSNARATNARAVSNRAVASRGNVTTRGNVSSRNVVSRGNAAANRANAVNTRSVRARTATTDAASNARISLQGSAIRGSKSTPTTSYSYLTSKLYTGNYSNIIDSSTGLISNEAFTNCMESYYTCMDEICTARNSAQRRCACAGRVKAFAEAESALESANEELIKVSGELALLIANKGKDVSEAFQLTEAEQVMNCVSWQDVTNQYGANSEEAIEWCYAHGIYGSNGANLSSCAKPSYCSSSGNNFNFDVSNLDGSGSDILASLQSWADAKEQTLTIMTDDTDSLTSAFDNLSSVVSGMAGISGALSNSEDLKDSLAETWGYELFEYAHNNVCGRVLDSCFNGIFEACGTPPSGGRKCSNGASQCPYNYNSTITVNNTGAYELNFVTASNGYTSSNSATCFGYASASGDPYSNLRGPVADARRSIMQKYALDANADCDAYGEQLRTTAQNIGYQKVAAQQALQQKRLEFAQEEEETTLSAAIEAGTNFNECLSEIFDCYETQSSSNPNWPDARVKTYCAQIANVPHCYEEMICNPSTAQFKAVIDDADSEQCNNTQDYTTNTCRNIVTLNEILNGTGAGTLGAGFNPRTSTVSAAIREQCLLDAGVEDIRRWSTDIATSVRCSVSETRTVDANAAIAYRDAKGGSCYITECNPGFTLENGKCVSTAIDCRSEIRHATKATRTVSDGKMNTCYVSECEENWTPNADKTACEGVTRPCSDAELNAVGALSGTTTWGENGWEACVPDSVCGDGKVAYDDTCLPLVETCMLANATRAEQEYIGNGKYGPCNAVQCREGYGLLENGTGTTTCAVNRISCDCSELSMNNYDKFAETCAKYLLGRSYGECEVATCKEGFTLDALTGKCVNSGLTPPSTDGGGDITPTGCSSGRYLKTSGDCVGVSELTKEDCEANNLVYYGGVCQTPVACPAGTYWAFENVQCESADYLSELSCKAHNLNWSNNYCTE